jgi:autotransporter-associated beta strand protein
MNKNIFKLVFSKKLGALVVASELATNSVGQGQSNGKRRRNLAGLAKALPLTMLLSATGYTSNVYAVQIVSFGGFDFTVADSIPKDYVNSFLAPDYYPKIDGETVKEGLDFYFTTTPFFEKSPSGYQIYSTASASSKFDFVMDNWSFSYLKDAGVSPYYFVGDAKTPILLDSTTKFSFDLHEKDIFGFGFDLSKNSNTDNSYSGYIDFYKVGKSTLSLADLNNSSVPIIFDGETLTLNKDDVSTTSFTVSTNGATLASSQGSSQLSGKITGAGGLTVEGTGRVELTADNDYQGRTTINQGTLVLTGKNKIEGGIQVNAGAELEINNANALGTSQLDLVGSQFQSAKLSVTENTTINNQISVSGDPTFNIAQNTTTVINNGIVDGVQAGDIVVQGGGTLALTAANTYSGPTTVDAGSTLALVGQNASIANSHNVTNNGTFDISQSSQQVNLVGNFTNTGNLVVTSNQLLSVDGQANLSGDLGFAGNALRPSRWTLLSATNGVTGHFNSVQTLQASRFGYLFNYDANNVYLTLTANAADTQAALQANAAALQGIYAIQTGTINNSLTYDCSYFDSKGFCLSTGGRYSNASNSHANTTSAMVVGGYRVDNHTRIGGYVDQNLYNTEAGSVASLRSNTPLLGVFAVWNENPDQTGFEAKLAAGYNNSSMDINRVAVGTSELGYGKAGIDTLSGSGTLSYGFRVAPNWVASPYLGVRHTTVSTSGYTEQADLISPLSYAGLNQESLTALVGLRASGRLTDQIGLQGSAGLEQDMHNYTSRYTASGLDGLTSIDFSPNMQKSRLATSFGASYDLAKGHRIGLTGIYRQESFQSVDTKMAYLTYTMGF